MDISLGSILLGLALLFLIALYVSRPFLQGRLRADAEMSDREALLAQKDALLEQIRLLDFEHETGKMPDGEYRRQRDQLVQQAAAILKQLDALEPAQATNGAPSRVEQEIEAAIASARKAPDSAGTPEQIEAAVQNLRRTAPANDASAATAQAANGGEKTVGRFCSQCGNPRDAGDKFCAYCGFRFA